MKVIVVLLSLMGAFAIGGAAADESPGATAKLGEFIPAAPPQPAPPLVLTDAAGNSVTLGDFAGKTVLVNLWATWCQPCLREMPSLERLQASLEGRLTVLAVSEDHGGAKAVQPFLEKLGLSKLKVYLDPPSDAGQALKARGLPTSVLIDAAGMVQGRVEGAAEWDAPRMLAALKPFLPEASENGPLKRAAR
ncbi:MAG: TlpA family protein disulfide reductase [Alphaproteobacteria bacterium]|nr:TlpA family protein disulfide reductase [Alphaproteobacteria bacterium]MBV9862127.1 TlpA family protein disulfide reductase [Alphaproteobacteria bacterium]